MEDLLSEPSHLEEEAKVHNFVTSMFYAVSCKSDEFIKKLKES